MSIDVPTGWARQPLTKLGSFHKSRGASKKDEQESGIPVVRYGELYTRHNDVIRGFHSFVSEERAADYTKLEVGDLLFAGSGETLAEIGKSAVYLGPEEAHGSGDIIILRPTSGVDPRFLGYASNGPDAVGQKSRMGQGSSVMHIYSHNLEKLALNVPPLPEQRKIAAILSSVDEAIQATQAVIEQTRRVKEGLLQDLLTRGIGHTRFKQTDAGEIPESWEVVALDSLVAKPICYGVLKPGPHVAGGVPVVRVQDYPDGILDPGAVLCSAPEIVAPFRRSTLTGGDILISIRGTAGRLTVVPDELAGGNVSRDSARISLRDRDEVGYLFTYLQSGMAQDFVMGEMRGLAVRGINIGDLRSLPVPWPPNRERRGITERVAAVNTSLQSAIEGLDRLHRVKAGLLQDLLTGKVRVTV